MTTGADTGKRRETISMANLDFARQQIAFVRSYTLQLIEDVRDEEYFVIPSGAVSHIAWQVGHLAMAQYGLTLMRIRDRQREDNELIPKEFIRRFKKQSIPVADLDGYPAPAEIREVFTNVHQRCLQEMANYDAQLLQQPLPAPTAVYENKLGSILFCPLHEMLHAGQIGALRRGLGKEPVR